MANLNSQFEITVSNPSAKVDPGNYNEALRKFCTLKTEENLSYVLHHMKSFVDAPAFNLNLFKKGVSASWEDPANLSGCSWVVQFRPEIANLLFERIASYFCINEFKTFECNGIKINVRRGYVKFSIWSGNIPSVVDGAAVMEELQNAFGFDSEIDFIYKNHRELISHISCA